MPLKLSAYPKVREQMQPGDIIAFGGKGNFSQIIKWATRSTVSHVGIIMQSELLNGDTPQPGYFNQIIESTSLNGFSGVSISRLSDRLATYSGEIWWLPLSAQARAKLAFEKFYNFLLHQEHKPYDTPQAVLSALDAMDNLLPPGTLTHNAEEFSRFFCSELCAAALEVAGVIGQVNASEVTPADLCGFNLYAEDYVQLKGRKKPIKGYNSTNPEGWGA